MAATARADGLFQKVTMDAGIGYIVPEKYAEDHKAELIASIPDAPVIDGFWTPTEQHVTVAERVFREAIQAGVKDPGVLLPTLAGTTDPDEMKEMDKEQREAEAIGKNYEAYARQYVGIIIDGVKLVLCNYSDQKKVDPANEYMYFEKYFISGDKTHFLQCRVDAREKTWTNAVFIGSWLPPEKKN
jgi:hypothetical protein